jgi:hypothetical protein
MNHNTGPSLIHRHACVKAQTNTHKTASAYQSQLEATKTSQYGMQFYRTYHNIFN